MNVRFLCRDGVRKNKIIFQAILSEAAANVVVSMYVCARGGLDVGCCM